MFNPLLPKDMLSQFENNNIFEKFKQFHRVHSWDKVKKTIKGDYPTLFLEENGIRYGYAQDVERFRGGIRVLHFASFMYVRIGKQEKSYAVKFEACYNSGTEKNVIPIFFYLARKHNNVVRSFKFVNPFLEDFADTEYKHIAREFLTNRKCVMYVPVNADPIAVADFLKDLDMQLGTKYSSFSRLPQNCFPLNGSNAAIEEELKPFQSSEEPRAQIGIVNILEGFLENRQKAIPNIGIRYDGTYDGEYTKDERPEYNDYYKLLIELSKTSAEKVAITFLEERLKEKNSAEYKAISTGLTGNNAKHIIKCCVILKQCMLVPEPLRTTFLNTQFFPELSYINDSSIIEAFLSIVAKQPVIKIDFGKKRKNFTELEQVFTPQNLRRAFLDVPQHTEDLLPNQTLVINANQYFRLGNNWYYSPETLAIISNHNQSLVALARFNLKDPYCRGNQVLSAKVHFMKRGKISPARDEGFRVKIKHEQKQGTKYEQFYFYNLNELPSPEVTTLLSKSSPLFLWNDQGKTEKNWFPGPKIVLMKYMGKNLFDKVTDSKYTLKQRFILAFCLLANLYKLHEMNLIHFDIKPENTTLVETSTQFKLRFIDFGNMLAKNQVLKKPGVIARNGCGTPFYAPQKHVLQCTNINKEK